MSLKNLTEAVGNAQSVARSVTVLLEGLATLMRKAGGNPNAMHALHQEFPESVPDLVAAVLKNTEAHPVPAAAPAEEAEPAPARPKRLRAPKPAPAAKPAKRAKRK